MARHSTKHTTTNLALLLIAALLCAAALECAFRYYLFGPDSFLIKKPRSIVDIGVSGLITYSDHPQTIYELKPDLDTYYYLAPLRTNSEGMRDREYPEEKPEDTIRVAVLGDSFTMPLGVEIEDAYHKVLESRLNSSNDDHRFEFMNFGVPGYSLKQYSSVLENVALRYAPDLVIVGFCHINDYHVPPEDLTDKEFEIQPKQELRFRSFAFMQIKTIASRLIEKVSRRVARTTDTESMPASPDQSACDPKDAAYMKEMFGRLRELTQKKDIPVLVVGLDLVEPTTPCADVVGEIAADQDLHYLEASGIATFNNAKSYQIYPLDGHPNGKANAVFADRILQYLLNEQLLARRVAPDESPGHLATSGVFSEQPAMPLITVENVKFGIRSDFHD